MNLTSVGYFREMPDGKPSDPSIKNYLQKVLITHTSDIGVNNYD